MTGRTTLRFARLCLAAAEIAGGRGARVGNRAWCANDWPSALTPAYMAWNGVRTPACLPSTTSPTRASATCNAASNWVFPTKR